MAKRSKDYEADLLERLKDPAYAADYLDEVLGDEGESQEERFLIALRDVARAHGMSQLSDETELNRQNLYRVLSEGGNPELKTLSALLRALGLRLSVGTRRKAS